MERLTLHDIDKLFHELWEREWRHHHRAHRLRFTFSVNQNQISGDFMQFTMLSTEKASVVGNAVTAQLGPDGLPIPSAAKLSGQQYTSSDNTIFTVAADPNVPGGAIITGVGVGTATLTEVAIATEPDGSTTEKVQGVATIVTTAAPPPPPPVAASIVFTFGTPTPQ